MVLLAVKIQDELILQLHFYDQADKKYINTKNNLRKKIKSVHFAVKAQPICDRRRCRMQGHYRLYPGNPACSVVWQEAGERRWAAEKIGNRASRSKKHRLADHVILPSLLRVSNPPTKVVLKGVRQQVFWSLFLRNNGMIH